ncbi:MAG: hypothetical protein Q8K86_08855 [Candidatus Nanopelagicaceae bacterium]|nr:hypothetical protein [Candidatus Nanopelagicaceae bacterium]
MITITSVMPLQIVKCERRLVEDLQTKRQHPVTRVTGVFQRANVVNANGRLYPHDVMQEAVKDLQEAVTGRKVLGELDHSADAKIHLDRVSHLISKLWMEGDIVFGECEILEEMPCGKMLKGLIDSGVCISVSSRGVGDMETMKENGKDVSKVTRGYKAITWDAVLEPSVMGTELSVMESKIIDVRKQHEMELLEELKILIK